MAFNSSFLNFLYYISFCKVWVRGQAVGFLLPPWVLDIKLLWSSLASSVNEYNWLLKITSLKDTEPSGKTVCSGDRLQTGHTLSWYKVVTELKGLKSWPALRQYHHPKDIYNPWNKTRNHKLPRKQEKEMSSRRPPDHQAQQIVCSAECTSLPTNLSYLVLGRT